MKETIPDQSSLIQQPSIRVPKTIKEKYFKSPMILTGTNIFQNLFFTYISPLLQYGAHYQLTQDAVPKLATEDCPKIQYNRFKTQFERERKRENKQGFVLLKSLFKTFRKKLYSLFIMGIVIELLQLIPPVVTDMIIKYVENKTAETENIETGLIYFFSLLFSLLLNAIILSQLFYQFNTLGYIVRNCLSLMIYEKALNHPLITQKEFGAANIINLSQVDAERLTYIGYQLYGTFIFPFTIVGIFIFLYFYIGVAFFAGIGAMTITILLTMVMTNFLTKINDSILKKKDERMKVTEELLQIIKFIKINAMERFFINKVNRKREEELNLIKKNNVTLSLVSFLYYASPSLIISITFLTYIALGNQLTPSLPFVVIIFFNTLQLPMMYLPISLIQLIQIWSSIKRIEKFLLSEDISWEHIQNFDKGGQQIAIQINDGTFLWGKEKDKEEGGEQKDKKPDKKDQRSEKKDKRPEEGKKGEMKTEESLKQSLLEEESELQPDRQSEKTQYITALDNINYSFKTGKLTMVIGDIGSGKSSLLYAILNEMTPVSDARINIYGSLAFVPQKPEIMSGTLKSNIIFGQQQNPELLIEAIKYSSLEDDVKILGKGIQTEIGQKGVNLSGGQKARVALARALYSNRNIFLLDDIISAVDVNVGNFIIQETIKKYLKGKTVIMPTHAIHHLKHAQEVVIMKKGKIITSGTYEEVSNSKQFQEINQSIQKEMKKQKDKAKEDENIIKEQKMVSEEYLKLQKKKVSDLPQDEDEDFNEKIMEKLVLEEEHQRGSVNFKVYKAFLDLNGGSIFSGILCISLIGWIGMSIYSNIQIQNWCNYPLSSKYLYFYAGLAVIGGVFAAIKSIILAIGGIKESRALHKKMINCLLYASVVKFYNRVPLGRIINRLSKDLKEVDESLTNVVSDFLSGIFKLAAGLIMCIYGSTLLVFIPMGIFFFLCVKIQNYYLKTLREIVRLESISASPIVSGFTTTVNNVATIRAYNRSDHFFSRQTQLIDTNKRNNFAKISMENWLSFRLSLVSFLVNMTAIAYGIFSSNENGPLVGLLLAYSLSIDQDLLNMIFSYTFLETKMIALERALQFTKISPENGYQQEYEKAQKQAIEEEVETIKSGQIEFDKFSTRYRSDLPIILKDISFRIKSGEKIGIVGRTGAGKSTLLNCLIRIVEPCSGTLKIDSKNIMDYELKTIRSSFTVIEQEPTLIFGNFRQNIDPSESYTDQQLKEHLIECNLWDLVEQKGGLSTTISNTSLSAGEKQLICISRAFLKKSRIVLIDEATANIDYKSDQHIQNLIQNKFKDSTVLTIAHRLSTLQNSDKILVLGEGRVIEWGTTEQLMQTDSVYRGMRLNNDKSYFE